MRAPLTTPAEVVKFWRAAGPELWFAKNAPFDAEFTASCNLLYTAAAEGELDAWNATPEGAIALVILLDQFPRNAFRDTPRMFASDAKAVEVANAALAAGHDQAVEPELRTFFYLPYEHAEDLALQERAVALFEPLGGEVLRYAEVHRDIIRRFGRFPHRNAILERKTTPEEQAFLDEGGFAG